MSDSQPTPIERVVDVVVFAPLGVALFARDTVPGFVRMFVARGRSEVAQHRRRVDDQVSQARTVGQFAVRFGAPVVRRQVEQGVASARARAEQALSGLVAAPTPPVAEPRRPTVSGNGHRVAAPVPNVSSGAPAPQASALPIPEYDELSASQVVERLDGLGVDELDAVRAYEAAHRSRRTILGKIAQLT